ncbi:MAG: alanine--glyoxylate aminotransferase family protein [Candidatus Dormibacteria bacterium]
MSAPLLMIPGPTPVQPDVLDALAEPVRSHTGAENAATMLRIQDGLRRLVGSTSARVYVFAGSGTLAMEAALVNHVAEGERVVVVSNGYFGDRFVEIAGALGVHGQVVRAEWRTEVTADALKALLVRARPSAVCITHVDTSTGVLASCEQLTLAVRAVAPETLVLLDGVCATGGIEQRMDEWDVDVVFTGAQKALGVPPGLALLAVSERARRRRASLPHVRAYYIDLQRWDASVDDPRVYFSTHATSLLRALEQSLTDIDAEGLEHRFARHETVAESLRHGMGELGFTPFTERRSLAPTLSVLRAPDGVDEARFRRRMADRGVIVAGCIGPWAGRGIRVGHMGAVGEVEVARTIEAAQAAFTES